MSPQSEVSMPSDPVDKLHAHTQIPANDTQRPISGFDEHVLEFFCDKADAGGQSFRMKILTDHRDTNKIRTVNVVKLLRDFADHLEKTIED
ncbi:MAG: hypothetical protein IH951_11790 [Bacteroidetes bacterium]|nr:hypothetical protein [Bacteroidota bacterium]